MDPPRSHGGAWRCRDEPTSPHCPRWEGSVVSEIKRCYHPHIDTPDTGHNGHRPYLHNDTSGARWCRGEPLSPHSPWSEHQSGGLSLLATDANCRDAGGGYVRGADDTADTGMGLAPTGPGARGTASLPGLPVGGQEESPQGAQDTLDLQQQAGLGQPFVTHGQPRQLESGQVFVLAQLALHDTGCTLYKSKRCDRCSAEDSQQTRDKHQQNISIRTTV